MLSMTNVSTSINTLAFVLTISSHSADSVSSQTAPLPTLPMINRLADSL